MLGKQAIHRDDQKQHALAYHHMSEAHLARYTAEFDFRYNTRKITDGERADTALAGIVGKRLTYRRTDKLAA